MSILRNEEKGGVGYMRRIWGIGIFIFSFGLLITGCGHMEAVQIRKGMLSDEKSNTSAVFYSKSFFQERFFGKHVQYMFIGGLPLQYWTQSFEEKKGARLASSDYEKLLGDFDVSAYFYEQLKGNIAKINILKISFDEDPKRANQIIQFISTDKIDEKSFEQGDRRDSCLAAFKLSYGLAAKEGPEQIGFRKYYRPFIMLLGKVKGVGSHEVVWQNALRMFGDKRYLGGEANADRINKEELVLAFKQLSDGVIDLLIRNLDGEELTMPNLVGVDNADNSF
jgi:hypothetical protein